MADSNRNLNTNIRVNGASEAAAAMTKLDQAEKNLTKTKRQLSGTAVNTNGVLISFGRIAQDMPYGIIGITNNVQQFAEQFKYLRDQTGSTKAAMTTFFSSFKGAGGWLFTISLATSLIQILSMQLNKAAKEVSAFRLETLVAKTNSELFAEGLRNVRKELLELTERGLADKIGQLSLKLIETSKALLMAGALEASRAGNFWNTIFGDNPEELRKKLLEISGALNEAFKITSGHSSIIGGINAQIKKQQEIIDDVAATESALNAAVEEKARLEKQRNELLESQEERIKRITTEQEKQNSLRLKAIKEEREKTIQMFDDIFNRISGSTKGSAFNFGTSFTSESEEKLFKQSTDMMEKLKASFERQGLVWNKENREWAFNIAFSFSSSTDNKYKSLFRGNVNQFNTGFSGDSRPWDNWIEKSLKNDDNIKLAKDFADSFGDMMQAAGTSAFEKIFGEANSLLEIFISRFTSKLLDRETESLVGDLFGWLPGGSILGALFGKSSSAKTVINVTIGNEKIQKMFDDYVPTAFNNGVRNRKIVLQ
jgi:uncharacterized protein YoxC